MIPVHHYRIKVDVDAHFKTRSGLYLDRIGSEADLLPKHGVVLTAPTNGKFNEGDTVYFQHFDTKLIYKEGSEHFVNLKEGQIIAANRDGKWLSGTMIPAKRIKNTRQLHSDIIHIPETARGEKWDTHRYKTDEGVVWIYSKSEYHMDYMEEDVFLRPNYIVYNEDKDESVGDFVILEMLDTEKKYHKTKGGIYLPTEKIIQRGSARVAKKNKYGLTGEVLFQKSSHNALPFDNLAAVRFQYILGCLEKN